MSNLFNKSITYKDGALHLKFSRNVNTKDTAQDKSFADSQCWYFLFPVGGGEYDSDTESWNKHIIRPSISTQMICIHSCEDTFAPTSAPSTPKPTVTIRYAIKIKADYIDAYNSVSSPESQELLKPLLEEVSVGRSG